MSESHETEFCIRLSDVGVRYRDAWAVRRVCLDVPRNAVTVLLGPSGCGKTSVLHAINRLSDLIPGCEIEGDILCDELDVRSSSLDVMALRKRVGLVSQKPTPFMMSVRDNLDLVLRDHQRLSKRERHERICEVLERVGLWDEVSERLSLPAWQLSGGQQQRLCIARSLLTRPIVLMMDEPCSALDPMATKTIEAVIRQLKEEVSIILVTHDLHQAKRLADHVALFWNSGDGGYLLEHGEAEQFFRKPREALSARYLAGEL